MKTNEQLYLTGLHLEQYRHATWSPVDYYEEALRRDPNDIRCLNAMGLWFIRKGRFAKAETYLRKAVRLSQKRNSNPYDGEPIYHLALVLKYQGRLDEALDELNRGLVYGAHNQKALALKAAVLRLMGQKEQAMKVCQEALATDLFNYGCRYEQYLLTGDASLLGELKHLLQGLAKNYDELALDYQAAGRLEEAQAIWEMAIAEKADTPMTYYYLQRYEEAEQADSRYCFPNRAEDVMVLEVAKLAHPQGAKAPYYLGCLYYAARQYDLAIENWELSAQLDPQFPTVWRNLSLARFNKQDRQQEALECMERAFRLDETDARVLMELDQLYKRLQKPHEERLAFLRHYPDLVAQRDDLVLEEITLLNQTGRYAEAKQQLDAHQFHPWEGGEGKVSAQYQTARVGLAMQTMTECRFQDAIPLLEQCLDYPRHLGEGKLFGAQENDFHYFLGCCHGGARTAGRGTQVVGTGHPGSTGTGCCHVLQ